MLHKSSVLNDAQSCVFALNVACQPVFDRISHISRSAKGSLADFSLIQLQCPHIDSADGETFAVPEARIYKGT